MRVSSLALAAGFILASLPVATDAQRPDTAISAISVGLMNAGQAAQKAGNLDDAIGLYESALVADPRNRSAIVALAQVARVQGLPGKAIALYREALLIEPNDVVALTGQGEAMIEKGAIELARENLANAQRVCPSKCPQVAALDRAIKASDERRLVAADTIAPKPVVGKPDESAAN